MLVSIPKPFIGVVRLMELLPRNASRGTGFSFRCWVGGGGRLPLLGMCSESPRWQFNRECDEGDKLINRSQIKHWRFPRVTCLALILAQINGRAC